MLWGATPEWLVNTALQACCSDLLRDSFVDWQYALRLYEAGAERISLWDCFHTRVMNRAEWNCVSRLGHREELQQMPHDREGYGTTCRILSLNGVSIAAYHPGWRG